MAHTPLLFFERSEFGNPGPEHQQFLDIGRSQCDQTRQIVAAHALPRPRGIGHPGLREHRVRQQIRVLLNCFGFKEVLHQCRPTRCCRDSKPSDDQQLGHARLRAL